MRAAVVFGFAVIVVSACKEAPSSGGGATSDPSAAPLPSATASATVAASTPSATASVAPPAASTATATSTAIATATATATSTATATPSATASASTAPAPSTAPPAPGKPVFAHFGGAGYAVDLSATGCAANADCTAIIRIQAQAPYHVNKEYPYKFTANDAANVTFQGADGGKVFSRASGAFAQTGETAAAITVRFRGTSAGTATVAGPFRLSVCTDTECKIDVANVSLSVPIQ